MQTTKWTFNRVLGLLGCLGFGEFWCLGFEVRGFMLRAWSVGLLAFRGGGFSNSSVPGSAIVHIEIWERIGLRVSREPLAFFVWFPVHF